MFKITDKLIIIHKLKLIKNVLLNLILLLFLLIYFKSNFYLYYLYYLSMNKKNKRLNFYLYRSIFTN